MPEFLKGYGLNCYLADQGMGKTHPPALNKGRTRMFLSLTSIYNFPIFQD